jgi:hypothetical protein
MVAIKDQTIAWRDGEAYSAPVKALVIIYARTLVALTVDGYAVPAGHADAVVIAGISGHHADNTNGFDGDGEVRIEKRRAFELAFDAPPAIADIGKPVYAIDNNTVSLSDAEGSRLKAGTLDGIERGAAWTLI